MKHKTDSKWLNELISYKIIKKYKQFDKQILLDELLDLQKTQKGIQDAINATATKIREIKNKEE